MVRLYLATTYQTSDRFARNARSREEASSIQTGSGRGSWRPRHVHPRSLARQLREDDDLDAPILRFALLRIVSGQRPIRAIAGDEQLRFGYAALLQRREQGHRPGDGQLVI